MSAFGHLPAGWRTAISAVAEDAVQTGTSPRTPDKLLKLVMAKLPHQNSIDPLKRQADAIRQAYLAVRAG
jgi:hypothetical protein